MDNWRVKAQLLQRTGITPTKLFVDTKSSNTNDIKPGLVVTGADSCSEGCGFESHHRLPDGLFHINLFMNCTVCL